MSNIDDDTLNDMDLARKIVTESDSSLVVVQYGKIWKEKKEAGVKSLIELIDEMGEDIYGSVIGTSFLCKASAFLCRYAKVKAVHSLKGTKTGIALLIMGGISSQVDKMITGVEGVDDGIVFFDNLLAEVDTPEDAYKILKENVK